MSNRRFLKQVRFLVVLGIVVVLVFSMTAFASTSHYVPPTVTYSYDNCSVPITIDLGLSNWGPDKFEDTPMQQWWKEKYNINLIMDTLPGGTSGSAIYDMGLNARIAAKDAPDVWITTNRSLMFKWANQGVSIDDVQPLIQKYMPTYSKYLEKDNLQTCMNSSKKIVAVPLRPSCITNMWILRKDWLDKLGLSVPKTMDDLYEVAYAFAKKDPDGNGKADTYAFLDLWDRLESGIFAGFDVMAGKTVTQGFGSWQIKNGKLYSSLELPNFRKAVAWFAKCVKEGVIHPDWATNDSYDVYTSALTNGKVGIMCGEWWWVWGPAFEGVKLDPKMAWVGTPNIGGRAPMTTPTSTRFMVLNKNLLKDEAKLKRVMLFLDQLMAVSNEGQFVTVRGVTKDNKPTLGGHLITLPDGTFVEDHTNCYWNTKSYTYASVRIFEDNLDQYAPGKVFGLNDEGMQTIATACYTQTTGVDDVGNFLDKSATADIGGNWDKFIPASLMDFLSGRTPISGWSKFVKTAMTQYRGNDMKAIYTKQLASQGFAVH